MSEEKFKHNKNALMAKPFARLHSDSFSRSSFFSFDGTTTLTGSRLFIAKLDLKMAAAAEHGWSFILFLQKISVMESLKERDVLRPSNLYSPPTP